MFKKKIKCTECGFIGISGVNSNYDTTWTEIQPQERINMLGVYHNSGFHITCIRGQDHVIAGTPYSHRPINTDNLLKNTDLPRSCDFYFPYNPGYTPEQHLKLLEERSRRRFLILVSLLSAAIGAALATIVNLIWK